VISLNRYQSEAVERAVNPLIISTGSLMRAKSVVIKRLEESIVAVEQMDWESFKKYVNFPIVCIYPDCRNGLTSPDPVNTAFKIEGYLWPAPNEPKSKAFERAKSECLVNLRNSLTYIQKYQRQ
tara:strand:- start:104842 stop:105213 length:372 start_codon:yes stop_codon:yes gene_type:complete